MMSYQIIATESETNNCTQRQSCAFPGNNTQSVQMISQSNLI